jgi:PhnB protein
MVKKTLTERLNDALDEILAYSEDTAFSIDPEVSPLLHVARRLRNMPREEFRTKLKTELERRAMMSNNTLAPVETTVSITPHLCCKDATRAMDFYAQVFGAKETMRLVEPDGRIGHAEMEIGKSSISISDEYPDYGVFSPQSIGGSPVTMHLYVEDVDTVARKAVEAGARLLRPVTDEFYGDRHGQILDPFGHRWSIATRLEEITAEEIEKRYKDLIKQEPPKEPKEEAPAAAMPVREMSYTFAPYFHVKGADQMIQFLKQAFFGEEIAVFRNPEGRITHAQMRIGEAFIEMGEAHGDYQPMPSSYHIYVWDADGAYNRALNAGAQSLYEPAEMPYGDREAGVIDPFGNHWYLGTRKPEITQTTAKPQAVPRGYHTVTPYVAVQQGAQLVDFAKRAFGAVETFRTGDSKTSFHAEVRIGDSMVMIGGFPNMPYPETPAALYLYVPDVDALYQQALQAGGISDQAPADQPYGDRVAHVRDPFGNMWYLATHIRDVE